MLRQWVSYLFAGGLATAVHYALLIALVQTGQTPLIGSSVGALGGALINYGLNRRYTFRSRRVHREALPRFLLTASSGFVLNGVVLSAVLLTHLHYLIAQAAATGVVVVWGFTLNRWWTFRGEGYVQ